MSYKKGKEYSLVDLENIKSSDKSYLPFYKFEKSFIEKKTIQILTTNIPEEIPMEMYKNVDAVGFFDSLHDFKKDFLDSSTYIRTNNQYSYKKFGFSFLLLGGYSGLNDVYPTNLPIQTNYSYLNFSSRPLDKDNLENYFSIGNIYDVIKNPSKGHVYILPNVQEVIDNNNVTGIYDKIGEFFDSYKDAEFGGKIKLVVDHYTKFFDIVRESRKIKTQVDKFCILYTAETINDPAPKSKALVINENVGYQNWYIEELGSTGRTYENNDVNGGVKVTFKDLKISNDDLDKAIYSVTAFYNGVEENITMNGKNNTIDKVKKLIINTIERTVNAAKVTYNETTHKLIGSDINNFYSNFNNLGTSLTDKDKKEEIQKYKDEYIRLYAKKRLGDTLQARICLPDKLGTLNFRRVTKKVEGKYELSTDNIDRSKTKEIGAVLLTHDRMLFSYAIINNVPAILDMANNMILFVPIQQTIITGTKGGYKSLKPKIYSYDFNKNTSTKQISTKNSNTTIKIGGFGSFENANDYADSVMDNIEDLIRYLYFFNNKSSSITKDDNFINFLKQINEGLQNGSLGYKYIALFYNRCLIVSPIGDIEKNYNDYITDNTNGKGGYDLRNGDKYNETILLLIAGNENFVKVEKINTNIKKIDFLKEKYTTEKYTTEQYIRINGNFTNKATGKKNLTENLDRYYNEIVEFYSLEIENNTTKLLVNELSENELQDAYEAISVDIGDNYLSNSIKSTGPSGGTSSKNNVNLFAVIFLSSLNYFGNNIGNNIVRTTVYNNILNANFNSLNNAKNLFQNNITTMYILFNLLRKYELSFTNYQEGIEAFYSKINESCVLDGLLGVTNLIPNNIEFYVFLKLILNDYSEYNVNNINYALFEYYLYIFKNQYNIYYRFQDIKSYIVDDDYRINVTPEIIEIIKRDNLQSLNYFYTVIKKAAKFSQTIIEQNYAATQNENYDIIYKNVDDYNLKLCGFIKMKTDFITKSVNIISSMASKGLLMKYLDASKYFLKQFGPMILKTDISQPLAVNVGGVSSLRKIKKYKNKKRVTQKNKKNIKKRVTQKNKKNIKKYKKTHKKYKNKNKK